TRIEYDALGRRIAESVSSDANAGPTDYFYYDGNRIIEHHTAPSGNPPPPPPPQEYSLRLDGAPPGGSVTRVPHHGVAHRFSGGGVESDGRVAHRFSGGGVDSDGAAADDVMYTAVADGGADTAWGDDWDTAGTEPRPSGSGQVAAGQRRIAHFSGGGDAASTSVTNTAANGARPTLAAGIVDAAPGAAATPRPDASPRDAASLASVPSSGTILPTHVRRPGDDQPPPPPPIAPQPGARLYVYGVDDFSEIVAFYDDPATPGSPPWFVVQDANSNVTGVFDANGTLVEQYAYTPYGETLAMENGSGTPLPAGTQPALSLAFQGMWRHPTLGLYFSTSGRLYSPALGRWMQRDPKGSALLNTDIMRWHARTMNDTPTLEPDGQYIDGLNPFGFVRCNPAVASDATGLSVDDIGYGSELLLDRNWDDIYDSVKGNGFAYLGVQGAATWGAAWGGNIASLPDFAIRSAELAEGVSDFADYYADQVIWLPVNVLLEGVGQFAHAAAAAAHAAEGAGDAISTASNLNRVGNAADAARDGFHGSYLAASALGAQGKVRRIRNLHLAGRRHPATGIPFDKDGFPDFGSVAVKTVTIQQTGNRLVDAGRANKRAGLTSTPNGYVWHHHQDGRRMLLVPKRTHQLTGHTGGVGLSRSRGRR
ncbi:MAG: HNH endonuclease, partial [Planctomycetes bacterium]|nr:HNH endonuclease [Planctomycetota bacterium]